MNHLFFDTETNGLPADYQAPIEAVDNWPRVLQLAWTLTDSEGKPIESVSLLINPAGAFPLDPFAARVHGLTDERLVHGVSIAFALNQFMVAVMRANVLVAHNFDFDCRVMAAEFYRTASFMNSLASNGVLRLTSLPSICTMQESTEFCAIPSPYRQDEYKWPKLAELHQILFDEPIAGAHDAGHDVAAMMRCFWALKERGIVGVPSHA
ncbi:MAG: 3'-5' exonuclease [Candidatus Melainabacteria bacterium HGW-Melainabacteria-1]|nr:MAG: 3'-5' exonuclease [Candidatus Melainabacteria bacterium HGW-Melainabacteria-1]